MDVQLIPRNSTKWLKVFNVLLELQSKEALTLYFVIGSATWVTQNRKYKHKVMFQEEGAIARERRELAQDGIDRLVKVLAERNKTRSILEHQSRQISQTECTIVSGDLSINGSLLEEHVDDTAKVTDLARSAIYERFKRAPKELVRIDSNTLNFHAKSPKRIPSHERSKGSGFDNQQAFIRFLKRGPIRGDGAYKESSSENAENLMQMVLPRDNQFRTTTHLWAPVEARPFRASAYSGESRS